MILDLGGGLADPRVVPARVNESTAEHTFEPGAILGGGLFPARLDMRLLRSRPVALSRQSTLRVALTSAGLAHQLGNGWHEILPVVLAASACAVSRPTLDLQAATYIVCVKLWWPRLPAAFTNYLTPFALSALQRSETTHLFTASEQMPKSIGRHVLGKAFDGEFQIRQKLTVRLAFH